MRLTLRQAHEAIYSQPDLPRAIKDSACFLFDHEIQRIDPDTGKYYTARRALHNVLRWMAGQKARRTIIRLTPAELRIMRLLIEGLTLKQIALEIGVSFETVKRHMRKVRRKTRTVSTYQAVAVAVDRGWVRAPRMDD